MTMRAAILATAMATTAVVAQELSVNMHAITPQGVGQSIGTVSLSPAEQGGTLLKPDLQGLTPGMHGFHVHVNPSCAPGEKDGKAVAGLGAGGHWDPTNTGRHAGPYGDGHLGDLPALYADEQGRATLPVFAPRVKPSDFKGHALMIHAGGDNYADQPSKLGGGGARVACGVVQ